MGQLRDRSRYFTSQGVDLIRAAMQQKGWIEEDLVNEIDALTKKNRKANSISHDSICKYLSFQRPPQKKNIILIANLLGLNPNDLVEDTLFENSTTNAREVSVNEINLRSVSKNLLEDLKRLTTEALTAGDGIRFDFDDVFVPLGVVERQQKTKRKEDDGAPDRGSELYEEKVTPITQKDFFEDVLLQGNTRYSNGKRIVVIGEAGAGKTTQLQKIGSWLLEESDNIPIWISLTDLGAKSLREYLFENWVREASGEIEAAPQVWKDSLGDAIKAGKVWLLLDGVDEMTVSNPLFHLSTQLNESWLKNARVILTCRVNVWDGGKNALTGFDVYRNLDFDYPDDVYKFIGKWFARAPELAGSLTQALEQSGKERIRDMVKNPLRLTLLCYSWQLKQGELPETKAGLYEWFVEAFYKWNKGKAQIELSRSQEKELNRALGELAKRAIDGETSRFRLTKAFIENIFREFDIDLFDIALKLNWLNEIGVAAENPLETVYAFYHPSFQEYFAALAIDDWNFFLPRNHLYSPIEGEIYRIFDAIWMEVVSFWFGLSNNLISDEQKNNFIQTTIQFNDNCEGFFKAQAGFSIALATVEYKNCKHIEDIAKQILPWGFYLPEMSKKNSIHIEDMFFFKDFSLKVIKRIDCHFIILLLTQAFLECKNEWMQLIYIQNILSISPVNNESISQLKEIAEKSLDPKIRRKAKEILKEELNIIDEQSAINHLKKYINNQFQEINDQFQEIKSTEKVVYNKLKAIDSKSREIEERYITSIKDICEILKHESTDEFILIEVMNRIREIGFGDREVIESLQEFISTSSFVLRKIAVETLVEIDPYNIEAVDMLIDYLVNVSVREYEYFGLDSMIVFKIITIVKREFYPKLISKLKLYFFDNNSAKHTNKNYFDINFNSLYELDTYHAYVNSCRILWHCAQNMSYPDFYEAWHSQPTSTYPEIADTIPSNNINKIQTLEKQLIDCDVIQKELDRNTDHPEVRCLVIDICHLEQESDPNVIAKKFTNKIFNSIGRRIPVVQDISCLERELLNLKLEPDFEKLAIALYGKSANEAIHQLCQSLSPIPIRLFTGGQTTQELIAKINAWLSEM